MTTLAHEPAPATTGPGDDLDHVVCDCDDDTALCGADVSAHPWGAGDPVLPCVVCLGLVDLACPRCGL